MLPMFIPWDCAPDKLYMLVVVLQKLQLYAAQGYDLREGVTGSHRPSPGGTNRRNRRERGAPATGTIRQSDTPASAAVGIRK